MKITNQEILNFIALPIGEKKLPVQLSYAISVNLAKIKPILEVFNEHRMKLVLEHCKKDENGNPLVEDDCYLFEDVAAWNKAIMELNQAEVEVDLTTVPIEVLAKCDDSSFDSLSVNEVTAMGFMIGD
jgi:hypothetical protein